MKLQVQKTMTELTPSDALLSVIIKELNLNSYEISTERLEFDFNDSPREKVSRTMVFKTLLIFQIKLTSHCHFNEQQQQEEWTKQLNPDQRRHALFVQYT